MSRIALVRFILGHRALVVGLVAVATAALGWQAAQVGFDNSIEIYFQQDDIADYRRFLDHFGTDEIIAIAFEADVFSAETLRLIERISQRLEALPNVRRVLSLTEAKVVFGDDESIHFDPLVEEIPASSAALAAIRQRALADGVKRPALLHRMESLEEYLRTVDGVTGVYSLVGMVKALDRAFYGGAQSFFRIPASATEVAQQLLLVEGSEEIDALLAGDGATARVVARIEMTRSQELSRQMPEIEQRAVELFGATATVTPTGMVHLTHRMERYLLSSQIKSLSLAFVVISLLMLAMLSSLRLALAALIPNLLPILFTLALMPWLGIPLDVSTVMIAVIALGLVVDDTIHLLTRLKAEVERAPGTRRALRRALTAVGRPIIYTSVALSLGFLVLVFASFNSMIHFGVLSATVIALALAFDLVVLPALVGFLHLPGPPR